MLVLAAGKTCTSFYTYLDILYIDYLLLLLKLSLCFSVLFFLLATTTTTIIIIVIVVVVILLTTTTSFAAAAADFEVYLNKVCRMATKTNARVFVLFSYRSLLLLYIIAAAADTNILLLYCWVVGDVVCVRAHTHALYLLLLLLFTTNTTTVVAS